jgi:arginyl-tRNA synthetase
LSCNPEEAGSKIGEFLKSNSSVISDYNVVKGFLNLDLSDSYFKSLIHKMVKPDKINKKGREVMVEFASPNTNKPLHLGHLRNIFLGDSVSRIYDAYGFKTHKVQIINDRGIHICKSMVAWRMYSDNKTPDSEGIKGDKFVGNYYVKFELENQKQIQGLIEKGYSKEDASKNTALMKEAVNLLKLWENQDSETIELWKKMNGWVYEGFDSTHKSLNIKFDKNYYESDTYLLGKKNVLDGLKNNVFYQKEDKSIWVDLVEEGLDNKILIRSDGTSVYMTQDIGTAIKRFEDYPNIEKQIYTVGNEQDYHFKVLFTVLKKLDYKWADECYHLSYGMVDLPDGKMKSREGKVVDADDLVTHMIYTAKERTLELGKVDDFEIDNLDQLCKIIALGALKYFLLKVDPKKKMLFNPEESIDFNGNTGPFIQYTYARIRSIIRRADKLGIKYKSFDLKKIEELSIHHKKIINHLDSFSDVIELSAKTYSPSNICQYVFELSKLFNSFYQDEKIIDGKNNETTSFKIALADLTSLSILRSLDLLGIDVPEKM